MNEDDGPLHLELDKRLYKRITDAVMVQINQAVGDCEKRDQLFQDYRNQLRGLVGCASSQPWNGSAEVDDPITMDIFIMLWAMLWEAFKRDPLVMVEGAAPEDVEAADEFEPYLTHEFYKGGITSAMWGQQHNCLLYPFAISRTVYTEQIKQVRGTGFRLPDSDEVILEHNKEENVDYEEVPITTPEIDRKGLDIEPVNPSRWYTYPSTCNSVEDAEGCGEYVWWTQSTLLKNMKAYGLDEDSVFKLLKMGPDEADTGGQEDWERQLQGIDSQGQGMGMYKIFMWWGKMPILTREGVGKDGSPKHFIETPEYLWEDDFLFIGCPHRQVVLRYDFWTEEQRPYDLAWMLEDPGKLHGYCLPEMLNALQAEANALLRHGINCMNLEINPMLKVNNVIKKQFVDNFQFGPGGVVYVDHNEDVEPLNMNLAARQELEWQQLLQARAEKLIAAGGIGSLPKTQRKAAEVQAMQQVAASKFSLYASSFASWLERLWRHGAAILANHANDEEEFIDADGVKHKISAQQLKKQFIFKPVSNALNASPEHRLQIDQQLLEMTVEINGTFDNPQVPLIAKEKIYHAATEVAHSMGKHNPQAYFGEIEELKQRGIPAPKKGEDAGASAGGNAAAGPGVPGAGPGAQPGGPAVGAVQ